MKSYHPNAEEIAKKYIGWREPLEPLGWGVDGVVYPSINSTNAVKVHTRPESFQKELAAYHRLREHRIQSYQGFSVPQLVQFNRKLQVIEMSIVKVPFLLDFAAAELDVPREFSDDAMADWWTRVEDDFGDDFDVARSVYFGLVNDFGLYYWDMRPRNLCFR
jgi:hypothetical protein